MKIILSTFLAIAAFTSYGQISYSGSQAAFNKLFEGALVVRLHEQLPKQRVLEARGDSAELLRLQNEIEHENRQIREAFANEYTATPVYFIKAFETDRLIQGDWNNLLTNAEGEYVEVELSSYLLADFGETENLGLDGLNIWEWVDGEWRHPPQPFPSFISRYGFLRLVTRTHGSVVSRFNARVVDYRR